LLSRHSNLALQGWTATAGVSRQPDRQGNRASEATSSLPSGILNTSVDFSRAERKPITTDWSWPNDYFRSLAIA